MFLLLFREFVTDCHVSVEVVFSNVTALFAKTRTVYLQAFRFLRYGTYFYRMWFSMLGLLGMYSRSYTFNVTLKIPEILSTAHICLGMEWSQ
jgi:hypothetical protein